MIRPKKGLGRGLDALLVVPEAEENAAVSELQTVEITRLRSGKYQPRTRMDEASLEELAASIREQGVMQPIIVREIDGGYYEIIAGERRWRAAQRAGLKETPVLIKKNIPDQTALAWSLIENIQREDLNPLEEAQGLHRLISEFSLKHEDAAKAIGRSRSAVTNLLRLLQLAKSVQQHLAEGRLEMGHARALLPLPEPQQELAATRIIRDAMSVRDTERLAQKMQKLADDGKKTKSKKHDIDTARLEEELSNALAAKVRIETDKRGGGKVIIHYANLDILEGILARLR
ncbi:MAG: ParB/RepB/Spo0J family partition protein [Burkholderiales bacterium]|nr:ParB/RepB/Spo0J family partition protein [Burkholderiales bacterium]